MRKILSLHIILGLLAVAIACDSQHDADAAAKADADAPAELALPTVPGELSNPRDRAAYVAQHYWDDLDFADTARSLNRDFMEQNFANFAAILPLVEPETLQGAINHVMTRAEADTAAYNLMTRIADKYLYEPNSPMLNEDIYDMFLTAILSNSKIEPARRVRYEYQKECIAKNRSGSLAADFAYADRQGRHHTLLTTESAERMLLIFFDPDCEECKKIIGGLKQLDGLNALIEQGRLTILAIYTEGKAEGWDRAKQEIPANWLLGNDLSGIDDNEIYTLRAMPTIYVLDASHTILLKDVLPEQALAAIE